VVYQHKCWQIADGCGVLEPPYSQVDGGYACRKLCIHNCNVMQMMDSASVFLESPGAGNYRDDQGEIQAPVVTLPTYFNRGA
jgi:hypothetical protein